MILLRFTLYHFNITMSNYNLIIDIENRRLVADYLSTEAGTPPVITYGDKPTVSVRLVTANDNNGEWPWRDAGDLTGQTIRLGIGSASQPQAGTYTLLYGGDETTPLQYDATNAEISTAINLLDSVIAAGGVSVETAGGALRFTFTSDGARTGITANVANIYPESSAYVYEAVSGGVSSASIQHLSFESNLSAYVELTDDVATPTSAVTTIREGVTNTTSELQRIQLLNNPIKGSYTITIGAQTTTPLDVDSNIDSIVDAVEAMQQFEVGDVIATGTTHDYTLEFDKSLGDVGEASLNMDNIQGADIGKTGTLDLHTTGILELLSDDTEAEAMLEVVRWTTADVAGETVLQVPVSVVQDVIPDTPPSTTPLPGYATIDLDHINQSGAATGQIPTWNGSEWVPTTVAGTGDLLSTANLSDLADIPTARINLGLGTAATTDATDYATSAQGTLADSALQSADIDTLAELNAIVGDATLDSSSDARTPTAHTHTASDIDAEASADGYVLTSDGAGNAAWEASTGGSGHDPVTVTDSAEIDFTLVGQDITASLIASSIDETKLDASTNASLDLAASASQPGHTHTASDVTDFDTEVSNNTDVAANTAARHDAVTIAASGGRDYVTISGNQQLTLHDVDLESEVTGDLPIADGGTGASDAVTARTNLGVQSVMGFALSDETSSLTTGQKIATDMPVSMNVKRVYASVGTAGGTSAITIDVEDEGVTILNAVVSISAGANNAETSTFTGAASNYQLTKGDALTIDVDSIDDGTANGLKVYLIGDITA